jgi:HD-like signal output (HDOD) protein
MQFPTTTADEPPMIEQPLASLQSWVAYLGQMEIPVLKRTERELARLRENEDHVSGREIAQVVLQDPLMAVRVLAYIEAHRRRSQNADITTIDRAIMMLGITPFFSNFASLALVETHLGGHPKALLGLVQVVARARRAAHFARDWALVRHDMDVDEITVAALLRDIAEILLWCFAPKLALEVAELKAKNPSMRSHVAQQAVYGINVRDLQLALCQAWHLPELLTTLMSEAHANSPRVRNVVLADDLARHAANGWDDPALPDDFRAIANLLHMPPDAVMMRLGVDAYTAEERQTLNRSSEG